jgi:hypothetical protein
VLEVSDFSDLSEDDDESDLRRWPVKTDNLLLKLFFKLPKRLVLGLVVFARTICRFWRAKFAW